MQAKEESAAALLEFEQNDGHPMRLTALAQLLHSSALLRTPNLEKLLSFSAKCVVEDSQDPEQAMT